MFLSTNQYYVLLGVQTHILQITKSVLLITRLRDLGVGTTNTMWYRSTSLMVTYFHNLHFKSTV